MYIISYTIHSMVLVHVVFLRLLQHALKVGVHDKWDPFLPAVIIKTQPLIVFTRQPRRSLSRSSDCNPQCEPPTFHLSQSNVDTYKKIFYLLKTVKIRTSKYFHNFSKYIHTYRYKRISCVLFCWSVSWRGQTDSLSIRNILCRHCLANWHACPASYRWLVSVRSRVLSFSRCSIRWWKCDCFDFQTF